MNNELKDKLATRLKVDLDTSCWNWQMATSNLGYARVSVDGEVVYGHRLMYKLTREPIPKGMVVMHICDNPRCMNPDHLLLGTQQDNLKDMKDKGRGSFGRTKKNVGLETAREIRRKHEPYIYTMMQLAEEYDLTYDTIAKILSHRTYREPQG